MKICFASQSFYPHIGGVSTYLLNLCKELKKRGNQVVEIHLRTSGASSQEEVEGIEVHRVPKEPLNREMLRLYSKFKEAVYKGCHGYEGVFDKNQIDIEGYDEFTDINEIFGEEVSSILEEMLVDLVHIHDFQLIYLYKYVPRGMPLILTWHIPFIDGMSRYLKDFLVRHMKEYDKIIFSSQDYIEAAVRAGLPREKTELIYPICNTSLFTVKNIDREAVLKKYRIPTDSKIILCVQRVDPKSGHEQLVRAMPDVIKRVNAKLVFVGGESMSNKLSKDRQILYNNLLELIKNLGLSKHVIFTGNVSYRDLPDLYNAADIVALTSKNEGFGLSVTEAMSCGKAIVGTRVGGIPLQVKNGVNGYLVGVMDIKATAESLVKLLKNDKLREKMGRESVRIVKENFLMAYGIDKHIRLYNDVLKLKNEAMCLKKINLEDVSAFITDFDRTITDKPGELKEKTVEALKSLGVPLILVTGRPLKYVKKLRKKYKIWNGIVAENGAVIYLPKGRKTITISSDYIKKARQLIAESDIKATLGDVIISCNVKDEEKVKTLLKGILKRLTFVRNVNEFMILPKYVHKGRGVKMLLNYLHIDPEKTVLVGDAENDIDLFRVPGYKVAVANAHRRLKFIANEVTRLPSSEGVIEIINKLKGH